MCPQCLTKDIRVSGPAPGRQGGVSRGPTTDVPPYCAQVSTAPPTRRAEHSGDTLSSLQVMATHRDRSAALMLRQRPTPIVAMAGDDTIALTRRHKKHDAQISLCIGRNSRAWQPIARHRCFRRARRRWRTWWRRWRTWWRRWWTWRWRWEARRSIRGPPPSRLPLPGGGHR